MGKKTEIRVPDIGDFEKVPVIEVLVAEGDSVEAEQSLVTLESDKATMEVPSPAAGTLVRLSIKEGDEVSEGDVIGELETADDATPDAEEPKSDDAAADGTGEPSGDAGDAPATNDEAPAGEAEEIEIRVPDIGDFDKVPVIEVLVSDGDAVEAEQSLLTLESDKATMDIPAPSAGTLVALTVKVGDEVSEGDVIGRMRTASSAASPKPAEA